MQQGESYIYCMVSDCHKLFYRFTAPVKINADVLNEILLALLTRGV